MHNDNFITYVLFVKIEIKGLRTQYNLFVNTVFSNFVYRS